MYFLVNMWIFQPTMLVYLSVFTLWIQGSAALNARFRVQFGGNLYLLRRYDWIHRVKYFASFSKVKSSGGIVSRPAIGDVELCLFS